MQKMELMWSLHGNFKNVCKMWNKNGSKLRGIVQWDIYTVMY